MPIDISRGCSFVERDTAANTSEIDLNACLIARARRPTLTV
jgi:hypothetical protein